MPLSHEIKIDLSGISHTVRYHSAGIVFRKDQKIFNKLIGFADEQLLETFTFPFKYGDKSAFLNPGNVILSENCAEVYFGDLDPVGELIEVIQPDGSVKNFVVGGVFEQIPKNSSIRFDAVTLFNNYLKFNEYANDRWSSFVAATFIMTEGNVYPGHLPEIQNRARDDWRISGFYLEQLFLLS